MINNALAILFASGEDKLNELTIHRTAASLPYGGRYRLVDFALSNLVNSNITRIGIITRNNYSSLMDHLRMGRDWDLNRKNSGLAVFPPFGLNTAKDLYKGKIDALYSIAHYINKGKEEYVVISDANIAANINYDAILQNHISSGKPITMVYSKCAHGSSRRVEIEVKNDCVSSIIVTESKNDQISNVGLNTYIVNKEFLLKAISRQYAKGCVDFEKELLSRYIDSKEINAYEVTSYNVIIDDVSSYYDSSMDLLKREVRNDLFNSNNNIYTKVKDSAPTFYGANGKVVNSLVADGCIIKGTVINSILFRNVVIEEGAVVKDSIIMERGSVGENSNVSFTITDKQVSIQANRNISGFSTYPIVIVKNKTV